MRHLLQLQRRNALKLLHGLGMEISGQAIAQAKRMAFRPLGPGLPAHGFLATQFRLRQSELVFSQRLIQQPLPFIQQCFQGAGRLIGTGGEMPKER